MFVAIVYGITRAADRKDKFLGFFREWRLHEGLFSFLLNDSKLFHILNQRCFDPFVFIIGGVFDENCVLLGFSFDNLYQSSLKIGD